MMVPFIMVPIVNCAIGYFFVSMEIIHRLLMPCLGLRPDL
ncbi:PTS system transporter subunit IIC [Escherichia coli]|uniref:PTS system transporter subunit IIC n=1 Tax=Escherichia coli TaxID=562 RepID=A0A376UAN4_ECOLX|nr:PTS system transporter subunit IIC [Escherichia coli]